MERTNKSFEIPDEKKTDIKHENSISLMDICAYSELCKQ